MFYVFVADNENNRGQNMPSRREKGLIQVYLIYSLQFVTIMKEKERDRNFDAVCPEGIPRKNPA